MSYNMVGSLSRTLNNMSMRLWELVEQMTLNGQNMVVLDPWNFIIATHILTIYTSFSTMGWTLSIFKALSRPSLNYSWLLLPLPLPLQIRRNSRCDFLGRVLAKKKNTSSDLLILEVNDLDPSTREQHAAYKPGQFSIKILSSYYYCQRLSLPACSPANEVKAHSPCNGRSWLWKNPNFATLRWNDYRANERVHNC